MYIYLITNKVNGKKYVGQTQVSIKARFQKHTSPSNKDIMGKVCNGDMKQTAGYVFEFVQVIDK